MSVISELLKDKLYIIVKSLFSFSRILITNPKYLLAYSPILFIVSFAFIVWIILPNIKFNPVFSIQPIKPSLNEIFIILITIGAFLLFALHWIFPGMLKHFSYKEKLEGEIKFLQDKVTLLERESTLLNGEYTRLRAWYEPLIKFYTSPEGRAIYIPPLTLESGKEIIPAPYEIPGGNGVETDKELKKGIKDLEELLEKTEVDYEEIESYCNELKKKYPDSELPYIILVRALTSKKAWARAKAELNKAEKINPKEPEIYYHYSVIAKKQGDYPEAKKQIKKAIDRNSKNPKYFILSAYVAEEEKNMDSAIKNTEKARSLIKDKDDYWYIETINCLEFYYTFRGAQNECESDFQKAGEIDNLLDEEKTNIYDSMLKPHYVLDTRGTYYLELYKYKKRKGEDSPELIKKAFEFFAESKKISPPPLDEDIYARLYETIRLLEEENLLVPK